MSSNGRKLADLINAAGNVRVATEAKIGFMSADDKLKLDAIETGATADQTQADIAGIGMLKQDLSNLSGTIDPDNLASLQGPIGPYGPQGELGPAFVYEDFSEAQLVALSTGQPGADGQQGTPGENGSNGKNFVYTDFTDYQLYNLQGPPGAPGVPGMKFSDFSAQEVEDLRFNFEDFTPAELESLRGPIGPGGLNFDTLTDSQIAEITGPQGDAGTPGGPPGPTGGEGPPGTNGKDGDPGPPGQSFYGGPPGVAGNNGIDGRDGAPGASFLYEYFTADQLNDLKNGPIGPIGVDGPTGPVGPAMKYADLNVTQISELKSTVPGPVGPAGDPSVTFDDLSKTQKAELAGIDGQDGDAFTFAMFTPEQLDDLRLLGGPAGKDGVDGKNFYFNQLSPTELLSITGPTGPSGGIDGIDGARGASIKSALRTDSYVDAYNTVILGNFLEFFDEDGTYVNRVNMHDGLTFFPTYISDETSEHVGKVIFSDPTGTEPSVLTGDLRGTNVTNVRRDDSGDISKVVFSFNNIPDMEYPTSDGVDGNTITDITKTEGIVTIHTNSITTPTFQYAVSDGDGWSSASYDNITHQITFNSYQGLGFTTGNLKGEIGDTGPSGKAFVMSGTYTTLVELQASTALEGEFAMLVNSDPYHEDHGNLYMMTSEGTWTFLTDMSVPGATGIQGDPGNAITSITKAASTVTVAMSDGTNFGYNVVDGRGVTGAVHENDVLTFNYTDGTEDNYPLVQGLDGKGITTIDKVNETLTISYDNGDPADTFHIPDGKSITGITKSGPTVTIEMSDASVFTYSVVDGAIGPIGPIGPIGVTGDTGDTGVQGPAGLVVESVSFAPNDPTPGVLYLVQA